MIRVLPIFFYKYFEALDHFTTDLPHSTTKVLGITDFQQSRITEEISVNLIKCSWQVVVCDVVTVPRIRIFRKATFGF